jgi:hypothetical protein
MATIATPKKGKNAQVFALKKEMRMRENINLVKSVMAFKVGAVLKVAGRVQKVVKRDGQCKLVIKPESAPEFVVFADCISDAETVRARKIRKGSLVSVRGSFASYGSQAVCLIDCRLMAEGKLKQVGRKKSVVKTL